VESKGNAEWPGRKAVNKGVYSAQALRDPQVSFIHGFRQSTGFSDPQVFSDNRFSAITIGLTAFAFLFPDP
jgi:hypothetical protein